MFGNMLMGAAGASLAAAGGYSVSNSILLDDGSSQYLTGSTLLGGSERIGTYSFWTKRANLGTQQEIYTQYRTSSSNMAFRVRFLSGDTLDIVCENDAGSVILRRTTTQVFRDPHAFLHVHIQVNGNQTDDTCCTLTINGSAVSDFSTKTNLSSGTDLNLFTSSKSAFIGSTPGPAGYYDGYFSEFVAIDGGNAAATNFGEYDLNGVWRPIAVTDVATDRDQIPALTSNSAPSPYVVTASSEDGAGSEGYRMFANGASSWRTTSGAGGVANIVIDVGSANAFAATSLVLTGTSDAATRCPTNFTFEGSNTGSFSGEETVLHTGSSLSWSASETKTFTFSNTTSFRYYKLDVTSTSGGTYVEIEEGEIRKQVTGDFGSNGFYLPFTDGTDNGYTYGLGLDLKGGASVPTSNYATSGNWTGDTANWTWSGTNGNNIESDAANTAIRSSFTFTGDFDLFWNSAYTTGEQVIGVYDISEDATFSQSDAEAGMDSMTNSWYWHGANTNAAFYGSASQASVANGSVFFVLRRRGSTFQLYRNGAHAHTWSQTSSVEVRVAVGAASSTSNVSNVTYQTGHSGNDFFTSGSPTQSSDTPTNNYSNVTPLDIDDATLSNGNLTTTPSGPNGLTKASMVIPESGVWGVKITNKDGCTSTAMRVGVAIQTVPRTTNPSNTSGWYNVFYRDEGVVLINGSTNTTGLDTFAASGEYVEIIADMDAGTVHFYTIAGDQGEYTIPAGYSGKPLTFMANHGASDVNLDWDFGQNGYDPSVTHTGALALNTANLYTKTAPAIGDGTAHFQPTIYTGDGTAIGSGGQEINQSGNSTFQPDFVWIKNRSASTADHWAFDAIRGATKYLEISDSTAETTDTESLTSFDADGFTVGSDPFVNNSGDNHVGWQWKGDGTSGSSNTDGSIPSTVNVNDTAGFSIVKWTGTGANGTIGHGMSAAPDLIIGRNYQDAGNRWNVYHSSNTSAPETDYLVLNTTAATVDDVTVWNDTAPTASVFSVGTTGHINQVSKTSLAYCFRAISGYSAFGSFEGNGNSNGPLIELDFKPAYIMFKNIDAIGSWAIFDTTRDSSGNPVDDLLQANLTDAEVTDSTDDVDFLANGAKVRSTWVAMNGSGNTIIYIAFAEHPFAGTTPATAR